jgi:outer membrane protein assembly factor BamB
VLAGAVPAQAARVADWSTVGGNVRHAVGVRTTAWTTPHALRRRWRTRVAGVISGAPIILGREKLAVVTTSHGWIVALRLANGHVRWRFHAGERADQCPAIADSNGLGHVGVTGGAVLDPKSRVVYAVDALGYLHALRAATGHELRRAPVHPEELVVAIEEGTAS